MKLKHIALAAGALTIAAGSGGMVAADGGNGGGGWRTAQVAFTPTDLVRVNAPDVCDSGQQCAAVWTITATQTGDLVGSTVQGNTIAYNQLYPVATPILVTGTFTGSIKGCGTGGVLYTGRGDFDATGQVTWTYKFVDGSGTGDFAGISGTFRQSSPEITGKVRCQRPR